MAFPTMNHRHVLLETMNILNSNSLHFITFSLLFLPLTITTTTNIIQSYLNITSADVTFSFTLKTLTTLIIPITLSTFTATSLIAYTTLQIINNPTTKTHNLTLISTVKSLFNPLLSTIFAEIVNLLLISISFTLSSFVLTIFIKSLAFRFDVLLFSYAIAFCLLLVTVLFFKAILGFESQPSTFWLRSFVIFLYALFILGILLWCAANVLNLKLVSRWLLIVQVCAIYMHCSLIVTLFVVGNTVLYVRYKVACGEEAVKSAVDDERVGFGVILAVMFLQYVWIGIVFVGLVKSISAN